ncbi:MAG: thioredoxin domain-containing protein [Bdellovibrio sp.]|nr:thioredoxin domain-containing protein [Bdellovibrio sp.]
MTEPKANRLEGQKSSYLKQHAFQLVDWWPWSKEAIAHAQSLNRAIFLSIGYSTCHWCHVMAHESFDDPETAAFLNANFVCIKVDREEFPDIDRYYQEACQLFTQSGGWPLSAFLLPDLRPFFVGTYFPKTGSSNLPSFLDVARELARAIKEDEKLIQENAQKVVEAILGGLLPKDKVQFHGHFPHPMSVLAAVKNFQDKDNGGYGQAPKFPQHAFYEWAVEQMLEGMIDKEEGAHISKSLDHLLMGGIIDQVRGGMHRYSTDAKWRVPHFEKMLYDQAGLLRTLSKYGLLATTPIVFDTIINTLEYLEHEMLSDDGFFFSAQDADSEGVEGLYYTFSETEFEDALAHSEDEELIKKRDQIKLWMGISGRGNFDHGLNVLRLTHEHQDEFLNKENWEIIRKARRAILAERQTRIPPMTDTKGLASWNFLMISALADIIHYCPIDFIKNKAAALLRIVTDGLYKNFLISKEAHDPMKIRHVTTLTPEQMYSEDYVFFAEAMLRLYETTASSVFKDNFIETMNFILDSFFDGNDILTRMKGHEWPPLPNQKAHAFDSSYKSPRATLILLLRRGAILLAKNEWFERAQALGADLAQDALKNPLAAGESLRALTYPDQAYRVLKVPKIWNENKEFRNFLSYFMFRFVISYQDETVSTSKDEWQICNWQTCEMQGTGLESFIKTLTNKNTVPKS